MATRKKPVTEASKEWAAPCPDLTVYALSKQHFRGVVRYVKTAPTPRVESLAVFIAETMERLGLKRDLSKAYKGTPDGTDQVNVGGVAEWLENIPETGGRNTRSARSQVVALDATIHERLK